MREVVIDASELLQVAGLLVTTPLRTVVDLARSSMNFKNDDLRAVRDLMRIGRFGIEECRAVLDRRRNLPHKRLALERIDEAVRLVSTAPHAQTEG